MWWKTFVTLLLLVCVRAPTAGSVSMLDVCGRATSNPRIVGGADAGKGSWPWMVSLHNSGGHFCGGSLINNEWVLTAAHCLVGEVKSDITVYLGKWKQQGDNPHESKSAVNDFIIHDDYDKDTKDNDIALLQLSSAVKFDEYIKPICLADQKSNFPPGTSSWVTGWGGVRVKVINSKKGITTESVPLSAPGTLREISIPLYRNEDCNNLCKGPITSNMICVGTLIGGKGLWKGDSGGPMMSKQCSVWVQSGIASHVYGCAQPNKPNVLARVSEYKKWISDRIKDNLPGFVFFDPSVSCASGK